MRRALQETKIKGYVNVTGYRVQADENIDPGRYGFQIIHDVDKTHYFSSDEIIVIREWMKAIMKATITRDYSSTFGLELFPSICNEADFHSFHSFHRPRRIVEQHPHYPLDRGASNESSTETAFPNSPRCDSTSASP